MLFTFFADQPGRRRICNAAQAHQGLGADGAGGRESLCKLELFDLALHGFIECRVFGGLRHLSADLRELCAQPFHIRPVIAQLYLLL